MIVICTSGVEGVRAACGWQSGTAERFRGVVTGNAVEAAVIDPSYRITNLDEECFWREGEVLVGDREGFGLCVWHMPKSKHHSNQSEYQEFNFHMNSFFGCLYLAAFTRRTLLKVEVQRRPLSSMGGSSSGIVPEKEKQ